jgi:hypothetical protein
MTPIDPGKRNSRSQVGARSGIGGIRCRVLFRQERDRRQKQWASNACAFPTVEQESRTRAEAQRPEMSHRMRRACQRGQRRHGFNRCRHKNAVGMQRWVGLGVISDNLPNIGRAPASADSILRQSSRRVLQFCAGKLLGRGTKTSG